MEMILKGFYHYGHGGHLGDVTKIFRKKFR